MGQILDILCLKEDKGLIKIDRNNSQRSQATKRQPFKRVSIQNQDKNANMIAYQNQKKNQKKSQSSLTDQLRSQTSQEEGKTNLLLQKTESDFLMRADSMYFAGNDLITSFIKNKLQRIQSKSLHKFCEEKLDSVSNCEELEEDQQVESLMVKNSFFNYIETQEKQNQKLNDLNQSSQNLKIIESYLESFIQQVIQETQENSECQIDNQFIRNSIQQALSKQELPIEEAHYTKLRDFLIQNYQAKDGQDQSQQYIDNYLYLANKYSLTQSLFQKIQRDSDQFN